MKLALVAACTILAGALLAVNVAAQETGNRTITQEKIEKIRNNCTQNQASLNQLHQNDAFLRTDRGDIYRTISDKLMVPLNRRLAANQLDAGKLVELSATFSNQYDDFFDAYFEYDNALTDVLRTDCRLEPVTFYNNLLEARTKRAILYKANQALMETIREYDTSFTDFKANYEKENA